jgi:DNA-binding transcriptional LysR family regulator
MEWSDVRIFLSVLRSGSYGEAARRLGVSHPTVGRRIKVLEEEAGHTLFRRTADGLVLTDAGDGIVAAAEAMEQFALSMERRLAGNQERLEGVLRIGCAEWFANHVFAPVLMELVGRHPAVVPEVIAGYRLSDLSRRDVDVAFRIVPFTEPDVVQRRLLTMPYGLYGSATTVERMNGDPASVGLVFMNEAQSHFPDVAWLRERFPEARRVFASTSRTVQAHMCLRGAGLAVLPRPLGDAIEGLQRIDAVGPPPGRDIWVGYHRDLRRMDRLREFLDIADGILAAAGLIGSDKAPPSAHEAPELLATPMRHGPKAYEHLCTSDVQIRQCPNNIVLDSLNATARFAGRIGVGTRPPSHEGAPTARTTSRALPGSGPACVL